MRKRTLTPDGSCPISKLRTAIAVSGVLLPTTGFPVLALGRCVPDSRPIAERNFKICSADPVAVDSGDVVKICVTPMGFLLKRTLRYSAPRVALKARKASKSYRKAQKGRQRLNAPNCSCLRAESLFANERRGGLNARPEVFIESRVRRCLG